METMENTKVKKPRHRKAHKPTPQQDNTTEPQYQQVDQNKTPRNTKPQQTAHPQPQQPPQPQTLPIQQMHQPQQFQPIQTQPQQQQQPRQQKKANKPQQQYQQVSNPVQTSPRPQQQQPQTLPIQQFQQPHIIQQTQPQIQQQPHQQKKANKPQQQRPQQHSQHAVQPLQPQQQQLQQQTLPIQQTHQPQQSQQHKKAHKPQQQRAAQQPQQTTIPVQFQPQQQPPQFQFQQTQPQQQQQQPQEPKKSKNQRKKERRAQNPQDTPSQTLSQKMVSLTVADSTPMQLDPPKAQEKKRKEASAHQSEKDVKKVKVEEPVSKQPAEGSDLHITTVKFPASLKCHKALTESWQFMTEVQAKTLPHLLANKDVEAQAKTGSGKTLAFLVPAIEYAIANEKSNDVVALIMTPGRELALQTMEIATKLLKYHPNVKAHMIIGGRSVDKEVKLLNGKKQIIVATPGRLLQHLEEGNFDPSQIKYFVLDEADSLLDKGFYVDIKKIIERVPKQCQKALFTATVTPRVKEIGNLRPDAVIVSTLKQGDTAANKQCVIEYAVVQPKDLLGSLLAVLQRELRNNSSVIVFCETVKNAAYLNMWANSNNMKSEAYTAKMSQNKRESIFTTFRDKGGIMFASDIVARGADFPNVGLVIQIGVPQNEEVYLHRIGRTGRMGAEGRAMSILLPFQLGIIKSLERKEVFPTKVELAPVPIQSLELIPFEHRHNAFKRLIFFISTNPIVRTQSFESVEGIEGLKAVSREVMGLPTHKCIDWPQYRSILLLWFLQQSSFNDTKLGVQVPQIIKAEFGGPEPTNNNRPQHGHNHRQQGQRKQPKD